MAFVWPGHHYLDPGNKLEEFKPPVDSDDEIALLHDLNYKIRGNQRRYVKQIELRLVISSKIGYIIRLITIVLLVVSY
jgi:hypothetical protein